MARSQIKPVSPEFWQAIKPVIMDKAKASLDERGLVYKWLTSNVGGYSSKSVLDTILWQIPADQKSDPGRIVTLNTLYAGMKAHDPHFFDIFKGVMENPLNIVSLVRGKKAADEVLAQLKERFNAASGDVTLAVHTLELADKWTQNIIKRPYWYNKLQKAITQDGFIPSYERYLSAPAI